MTFILVYATFKDTGEAEKIIRHLLEQQLIACGNIFPVTSFYRWKDEIASSSEITALLKTRKDNWEKVKTYIESVHSYEIPCVIRLEEVESNESFAAWIQAETKE